MSDLHPPEGDAAVPQRTAVEILALELPQAFRGYRMRDVDALLGELALQVDAMRTELDRALGAAPERSAGTGPSDAAVVTTAIAPTTPDATASEATGAAAGAGSPGGAEPETAPIDAHPPRETLRVGAGARRRALVPSAALTLLAAVALVVGWLGQDRTATLVAIAGSAFALVGVGVAVWRTRDRATSRAIPPADEGTDGHDDADGADEAERTGRREDAGSSSED